MTMDCRDAVEQINVAAERLRRLCEFAGQCGRAGAAAVFYESDAILHEIDTARDVIAKSLGMTRGMHLEKLLGRRAPVAAKGTTTKRSRR